MRGLPAICDKRVYEGRVETSIEAVFQGVKSKGGVIVYQSQNGTHFQFESEREREKKKAMATEGG